MKGRSNLVSEVAVIRDIHQHLRASSRELAYQIGECRFVADKRADVMPVNGKNDHTIAAGEVPRFFRDPVHPPESLGDKLAKWHQLDLVIAIHGVTGWIEQISGVEGRARRRVAHGAEKKVRLRATRENPKAAMRVASVSDAELTRPRRPPTAI